MREVRSYGFRQRYSITEFGESMVQESHAGGTDVNEIVRKYHRTGYLPPARIVPQYVDCTLLGGSLQERIQFSESEIARFEAFCKQREEEEAAKASVVDREVAPQELAPT